MLILKKLVRVFTVVLGICIHSSSISAQSCWQSISTSNSGLPFGSINEMAIHDGKLWASSDYGVVLWDGNGVSVLKPADIPIKTQETFSIHSLTEGLFIGGPQGLAELATASNTWHRYESSFTPLLNDSVYAVEQDFRQHLYIGSAQGLQIIEGVNWFDFHSGNSPLPDNHVRSLLVVDSIIWVGTNNGLAEYDFINNTWQIHTPVSTNGNLPSGQVNDIMLDSTGGLWLATEMGLSLYKNGIWTKYTQSSTSNGLGSDQINAVVQGANKIYVATDYGFSVVSLSNLNLWTLYYAFNSGLSQSVFNDVLYEPSLGGVILASSQGIHLWDGTNFTNHDYTSTGMTSNSISKIAVNPGQSEIWFGYSGGIYGLDDGFQKLFTQSNSGLISNSVTDISIDGLSNLWASTSSGVSKYDGSTWSSWNTLGGLPSNVTYIIEGGLNGEGYLGYATMSNGLVVIDTSGNVQQYKTFNSSIPSNNVMDIKALSDGSVALATLGGLSIMTGTLFNNYTVVSSGLLTNSLKVVEEDSTSVLWIGSSVGLMKLDSGVISAVSGLPSNNIKSIKAVGNKITIVNGNNVSTYNMSSNSWTHLSNVNAPLGSKTVYDAAFLGDNLYIATNNAIDVLLGVDALSTSPFVLGRSDACSLDTVYVSAPSIFSSVVWNTGDTTQLISTDTTVSLFFSALDANGCSYASDTVSITINPLPDINFTFSNSIEFCFGDSIVINAGSNYEDYFWNNGASESIQTVKDSSTTLWLTVRDSNGCYSGSDTLDIVVWSPFEEEEICMVTVDSLGRNQIIWNKTSGQRTFEYKLYKENPISGNYEWFSSVPASGVLSVFSDPNSNARQTSSRYKISAVDSCGNESELSDNHKTMHLTLNEGISGEVNLIWDGYEGIDFTQYEVYRGSSPKNMLKLADVSSLNFTYTDINPPPGLLFYQVLIVNPDACTPTGKTNSFESSVSNFVEFAATDNLIIYPNPFSDFARVVFKNPDLLDFSYRIFDATGAIMRMESGLSETYIDLYPGNLPAGMYTIEVFNDEKTLRENFIIY